MLEGRDLSLTLGMRPVLRSLSISLRPGEVSVLFGPNGAGKTSLLRILGLLRRADAGRVLLDGREVTPEAVAERGRMGFMAHRSFADPALSGEENLDFYQRLFGHGTEGVPSVLRAVGLAPFGRDPVRTYSEGMTKRLELARLILLSPDHWLMDEPLSGLDEGGRNLVMAAVREATAKGAAVLIVSHERLPRADVADRILRLERGRLSEEAPS